MLAFDEASHTYTHKGVIVPGVTSIIERVLDSFSGVPEQALEIARARGTAVHDATAFSDLNDLDWETLDVDLVPYVDAWLKFRAVTGFTPIHIEETVFHPRHFYAGKFDRVGLLWDSSLDLIDIKSGALMPSAGPQTAAYKEAFNYRNTNKIRRRWVVQLLPTGDYKLHEMKDAGDFSTFLAALTLGTWRNKHGI